MLSILWHYKYTGLPSADRSVSQFLLSSDQQRKHNLFYGMITNIKMFYFILQYKVARGDY